MSNLAIQSPSSAIQTQPIPQSKPEKVQPQAAPSGASSLANGDQLQTYTVKKGDNLWNISKSKLGDPNLWKSIHNLNKGQIKNPDLIYPNQILKLPILAQPTQPTPTQPAPTQPSQPAQPAQPTPAPVQPTPAQPPVISEPTLPVQPAPPAVVDAPLAPTKPGSSLRSDIGRAAVIGGAIGAIGTAAALTAITANLSAPLSNLGGYGTAQVVAKKVASLGLKVPQGPGLSKLVSTVGGPKMAAAGVAIGVGLAVAGIAAGSYYLYNKAND